MARCLVKPRADDDLDSIWSFITIDNPRAADATIDRLTGMFDMLLAMPQAGRARPEFGESVRSFAVDNFVIYYVKVPEASIYSALYMVDEISTQTTWNNLNPGRPRSPDRRDGSFRRGR
jgi:toxin ParE1/3/4